MATGRDRSRPNWRELLGLAPLAAVRPRVGGLYGGSLGLALATRIPDDAPCVVVCDNARRIEDVAGDLTLFGVPRARRVVFPDLADDERGLERLAAITRFLDGEPIVLLASCDALDEPVPSPAALRAGRIELAPGREDFGPEVLAARLGADEWERVSLVTAPGEYSVRGDIVDLFPPGYGQPLRLEYFGDELETIRRFDPDTQRSVGVVPAVAFATATIEKEFGRLMDHLAPDVPVFGVEIDEKHRDKVAGQPGADFDGLREGDLVVAVQQIEPVTSGAEALRERIRESCARVDHAYFACRNDAEETRVRQLLAEFAPAHLRYVRGRLSRSFTLPERRLSVFGYDDLLQHMTRRRPAPKRHQGRALDDFLDLEAGDHVVHLAHGIGLFCGIETIDKGGAQVEHCVVEFADKVRVFVPVSKIDLIQKYVGAPRGTPRLAKIGGTGWSRAKERVKKAVTDLALRLLEIQAMREKRPGIAYPRDDSMQHEFEASFPYEETPDQLSALESVKQDMETARPMDRLLCGDVGYGKTEVAMRAAFKAVLGGRQVAVLVPTTVLAAQHYNTFRERMAGYPVHIEMLSRFRTDAEARATQEGLRDKTVDIVIGTHRLLSPKVEFGDLGLVVIDEEQRFGVEHKERLKSLRAIVDVLTMTATPIPRTLNLAMLGLRDISNLTTPPEGRMPVETQVHAFDEKLVAQYLHRELRRGGQVFFVHNRVQTIYRIERLVSSLVPSARRVVAHGRMGRKDLEDSMVRFAGGDADVLIATTIIESGLDIPNANTLIVDSAQMIGLADLHQLRGRVGRGSHKAYALFMLPPGHKSVGEVAEKRLRTIEEHSGLGAGFRIALKDLEIRGAGNILGGEQSGYIADVGYELYCRLLEDSVRELRNEKVTVPTDTFVDLRVDAALPEDYCGDRALKLGFYRKIAGARTTTDIEELEAELKDRFGPIPSPTQRLFDVARLRVVGQDYGIGRFAMETGGVLQMTMFDSDRALPFLRKKLGKELRLPENRIAIVATPVRPPSAQGALDRYLKLLAGVRRYRADQA